MQAIAYSGLEPEPRGRGKNRTGMCAGHLGSGSEAGARDGGPCLTRAPGLTRSLAVPFRGRSTGMLCDAEPCSA